MTARLRARGGLPREHEAVLFRDLSTRGLAGHGSGALSSDGVPRDATSIVATTKASEDTVSPTTLAPSKASRPGPPPRHKPASRLHEGFKPAIDHPLGVDRQLLRVHHVRQPLVGHHLGVDSVALRARLIGDPGEHHGLARLELDAAWERGELPDLDVHGNPFAVFQRTVLAPDLARLLRHAAVGPQVFLRHSDDKSIDVRHRHCSRCASASRAIMDYVWQQAVPGAGVYWSRGRSLSMGYGNPSS